MTSVSSFQRQEVGPTQFGQRYYFSWWEKVDSAKKKGFCSQQHNKTVHLISSFNTQKSKTC